MIIQNKHIESKVKAAFYGQKLLGGFSTDGAVEIGYDRDADRLRSSPVRQNFVLLESGSGFRHPPAEKYVP